MRNFDLTCGKNILEKSVELTMKRNLTILSQVFLMCTLFTNAWGVTNYDRCVEAYFKDKDYTNAYNICKEVEDPNAQYIIGEVYYYGLGVKEDYAEAAIWFRKAAEKGHIRAKLLRDQMLDKDKSK
jgi:TPR repeat protein